jgi:hypothetical protein
MLAAILFRLEGHAVGYGSNDELHITRATEWARADEHPITRAEWENFAEAHPKLSQSGGIGWREVELNDDGTVGRIETGTQPAYSFTCEDGAKVRLYWRDDHVIASSEAFGEGELLGHEAALAALAVQIRARLLAYGEDEYLPDGSRAHWDASSKPITPLRGAVASTRPVLRLRFLG